MIAFNRDNTAKKKGLLMRIQKFTVIFIALFLVLGFTTGHAQPAPAQSTKVEYEKGLVVNITPLENMQKKTSFVTQVEVVKIKMLSGEKKGELVDSFHYLSQNSPYDIKVQPGDKIIVSITNDGGRMAYHVSDFERTDYTIWLVGMFALSLIVVGRKVGLRSLFVIALSVVLVFGVFIPEVLKNRISLSVLSILVSSFIATISLVIITGWNRKSLAAIIGTVGGVVVAGVLSAIAIKIMHLSGLASEEAMMLKFALRTQIDFQGLLFASMMIGALGAIIDTTISIASAIYEIKCVQPEIEYWDLLKAGMNVGNDTMGMMSNTLILAYMGSSLPLMLLLAAQQNVPWIKIMNMDMIATEITRAMTGSIGLICAIPLTAAAGAFLLKNETKCDMAHFTQEK
jgi:uncharacterized membrane protein